MLEEGVLNKVNNHDVLNKRMGHLLNYNFCRTGGRSLTQNDSLERLCIGSLLTPADFYVDCSLRDIS